MIHRALLPCERDAEARVRASQPKPVASVSAAVTPTIPQGVPAPKPVAAPIYRITLDDRGYEERTDLRPNASVRSDGTVQLAPTQMKPPTPKDTSDGRPTGVTSGVIISKSIMGQRTDDENVPADWKTQRAPDFDWGR